ncbi:uncharacterized protein ACJ7VT_005351 [Polymixia lowei]
MLQVPLLLLLLTFSACCGYGFKGCSQNYPDTKHMWCSNQNITNISAVTRMIPENITTINLSRNRIRTIPPRSFSRLPVLVGLDLSKNHLVSLRGGEFRGLILLNSLNLTYNNISYIHPTAFDGLTSLQVLDLAHNRIAKISPGFFQFLPEIQKVYLSLNLLRTFSCGECGGSASLQLLDLSSNNIRSLNVSSLPALEYIKLSNNTRLEPLADVFAHNPDLKCVLLQGIREEVLVGLSVETKRNLSWVAFSLFAENSSFTICELLNGMVQLKKVEVDLRGSRLPPRNASLLDCALPKMVIIENAFLGDVDGLQLGGRNACKLLLNKCGLKKISRTTFDGYKGLKSLQLNTNNLVIHPDTFRDLSNLKLLSFDNSNVRDIDLNWFTPLKKLFYLSIPKNEITELLPNTFSALSNLKQLYLQFNVLKRIQRKSFSNLRKLWKLDLSLNTIHYIEDGSFQDLTRLRYLDLDGNRIMTLPPDIFSGLVSLSGLTLYNNRLRFELDDSPFITLTSLRYLELNYQGTGGGGIGDIGPRFFQGLRRLVNLAVGHSLADFHPEAFVHLANLTSLYIADMVMSKTNLTALFSPLRSLKKLTLVKTDLEDLPADLLPKGNSLELLIVNSNHLHTMDKTMLNALPRLRSLEIADNPLDCTCDNAWFNSWAFHTPDTQVSYLYDLHCDNNKSSPYLWQFDGKACSYEGVSFTFFITTAVMDVLFVSVCVTWHKLGPTLRYLALFFRAKLRGWRRAGRDRFQYDAFISYSSRDEAWVMEELVPRLEKPDAGMPRFRLCLHHRDFRPGAAVLENIEAAIYGARRTICVVTRHFLCSEWCSLEFQLASLRLLCDGSDNLLLVFLEEIPDKHLSPYTRLYKIVHKNTYLLWPGNTPEQDVFWIRLMDALKTNEEEE